MIDVCLILEGTYPYVAGGVATWAHQLISAMGDLKFGLISILPHSDPTRSLKYELPPHVVFMKDLYLHDYDLTPRAPREPTSNDLQELKNLFDAVIERDWSAFKQALPLFRGEKSCFDVPGFFSSQGVWELLREYYLRYAPDISFVDFFWTWRSTLLPLFQVINFEIPQAKIYHACSTGYAGLLGSTCKVLTGKPLFLTEHGIYNHERLLEISQANWIFEKEKRHYRAEGELSFFKRWWISLFSTMGGITYENADRIFTLFEGNRTRQVLEGASAEKIELIPNGIDLKTLSQVKRVKKESSHIGLVGRVVNIKDVKTFIQAASLILSEEDSCLFYIIGPTDEEEDYYDECRQLVDALNLGHKIFFTGRVDSREYYSFLDVVVLTSISEAQPYVLLEAGALSIPVVATEVGACLEMIEGLTAQDRALGPGGLITEVANPQSTAQAVLKIIKDKNLAKKLGASGHERITRFYDQDDLLSRYLNLYEQNL